MQSFAVVQATIATPSPSAAQQLWQQADEIDFILRHFIQPSCQAFKPSSSDESVFASIMN